MRHDSRLSTALHVLLHLGEMDGPSTSEVLGQMLRTNPVVFRRTMAGLRRAGIVSALKGHGGGWSLAKPLRQVTLSSVYDALGIAEPFALGHRDASPSCLLEQAVNRTVNGALAEAEALFVSRLRAATVADILAEAHQAGARRPGHARSQSHQRKIHA